MRNGETPAPVDSGLTAIVQSLKRPYRVTAPMVLFLALVPCYIFIAELVSGRPMHSPQVALDRALPLIPAWGLVYGTLYLYLIVLPVLVVRQEELIRRTVLAYLTVWIAAFACFVLYPTVAARPLRIAGQGFAEWGLRFLYGADPPYNCFPSLHVAHSFVSAFACGRVHRRVGRAALACAALVGLSTLFTKQHYVLDVVAGFVLAFIAARIFLRPGSAVEIPDVDRRVAPLFAAGLLAILVTFVGLAFASYHLLASPGPRDSLVEGGLGASGAPRSARSSHGAIPVVSWLKSTRR